MFYIVGTINEPGIGLGFDFVNICCGENAFKENYVEGVLLKSRINSLFERRILESRNMLRLPIE